MITGVWAGPYNYRVTDTETGKSEDETIMGTEDEMSDPVNMQELAHYARERVVVGWRKEKPVPHTPEQRRDLGQILKDISASRKYKAENEHSRYWKGIKNA